MYNATNLNVHALISGFISRLDIEDMLNRYSWINQKRRFKTKSFTLIYEHNSTQTKERFINIGERQTNDKLIHTESKLVTSVSRFAEDDFQYEDELKSISCVEFSFDVSEYSKISYCIAKNN